MTPSEKSYLSAMDYGLPLFTDCTREYLHMGYAQYYDLLQIFGISLAVRQVKSLNDGS